MRVVSPMKTLSAYSFLPQDAKNKLEEKDKELEQTLKNLQKNLETPSEREKRLAAERKENEKRRLRQKKINKLNGDIAFYRSRLMVNPDDKTARGALAMAKCQRYWAGVD